MSCLLYKKINNYNLIFSKDLKQLRFFKYPEKQRNLVMFFQIQYIPSHFYANNATGLSSNNISNIIEQTSNHNCIN